MAGVKINTTLGSESIQISGQDVLTFRYNSYVPTRQTVLAAAVDSNGFTAIGGSTGSTTLTTTAISVSVPFVVTAANSFNLQGAVNVMGMSTTNLSWTGLSTNGTMYLYVDIGSDGTVTTGSGTLAPVYQFGGTYSTTSGQFTFNIQEMVGKVGNGATAVQTYRVYVGEVVVSGGVVASIIWYALQGRYDSGYTATLPTSATNTVKNHLIGVNQITGKFVIKNLTTELNWSVGDEVSDTLVTGTINTNGMTATTRLTISYSNGDSGNGFVLRNKTTGATGILTNANWAYRMTAQRSW